MRKFYLIFIVHCALSIIYSLNAQDKTVILFEDFENGIPTTWSQDKIIGDYDWVVESGDLKNPEGAFSGSKRLAFRNNSNQTSGNVTRLILPEMDLSSIFHPILSFSYAQDKWTGDFDTLRVLYRRTPTSKWITVKTYDVYSSVWMRDTIRLAAVTSTYQIAFEAKDNLGRGVVIDDVEIRSIPNCTEPFNLMVSKIRGSSVRLEWAGSFDALKYLVKISETPLSVDELYSESLSSDLLYEVDGAEYSLDVVGLKPATHYYFYVRSVCIGENSNWSDAGVFETSDMVKLPYVENFNMEYVENAVSSVHGWFCFSSNSAYSPFVNTDHLKSKRLLYSRDSTTALFFQGASNVTTPIEKGDYSYAVIPEIDVDKISRLQLSFWTINNVTIPLAAEPAVAESCKILVGVMTDPSDKNTFVLVDTIEVTSTQEFEEKIVSFENYMGDGKFIAFMSDFKDRSNAFVIEDVLVDYIPTTPKAKLQIGLPASDEIDVKFLENVSDKYEVIVANALLDVNKIDNKKVIKRDEFSSKSCHVDGLQPWAYYFVYGRHLNGEDVGEWSNPVKIMMPDILDTVPSTIVFDINTFDLMTYYNPGKSTYQMCNGLLALSNNDKYPTVTNAYWTEPPAARSKWELSMTALFKDNYQMTIFPEMLNVNNTKVSFYAGRHLRVYLGGLSVVGAFAVGVVSDANDVNSFQPIDTIILNEANSSLIDNGENYSWYEYDLSEYDVDGAFFAIKTSFDYAGASMVWIDDVRFVESDGCAEPSDVDAVVNEDEVVISWNGNGASDWNVLISRIEYSPDELDTLDESNYFVKQTTNVTQVKFTGLQTGNKKYYYYIQPICNDEVGAWTLSHSFETGCPKLEKVPYYMNFDDKEWLASYYLNYFTVPCLFTKQSSYQGAEPGELYYYPYLSSSKATTGNKSLVLGGSMAEVYSSYIAFPKIDAELQKLQISFDMVADSANQFVEVGIMSDPLDIASFVPFKTLQPSSDWKVYNVKFSDCSNIGHIAIRTSGVTNLNYIDNVAISWISSEGGEVDPGYADCPMPQNIQVSDLKTNVATINWDSDADKWNLVVAKRELTIDERVNAIVGGDILVAEEVNSKSYKCSNLEANSTYFVYLQAICNDTVGVWAFERFYTECTPINTYQLGVESFDNYGVGQGIKPNCYVVGNLVDNAPAIYVPYCSDEYAYSGLTSLMLSSTPAYREAYAITPELDIDNITKLRVRFRASVGEYYTSQYARELTIAIITDPSRLDTKTKVKTIKIYPGESLLHEVRFDDYIGDADGDFGRYVMFSSYSTFDNTIFIDDVVFDTIPSCVAPKVEAIDNQSNYIEFKLSKGLAPYKVKYILGNYSDQALEQAPIIEVKGDKFTIDSLGANTDCYLLVGSSCDDWSDVLHFVSANADTISLPYFDPFTQNKFVGEYNNPLDWTSIYTSENYVEKYRYPYVWNDNGDDKVVYLYSDAASEACYMATPYIDVNNLNQCQVSFNYKPDVSSTRAQRAIIVGVATDVSTKERIASTFVPIDTIVTNGATQYKQYTVSLDKYLGTAKHVVFSVSHSLNRTKLTEKNGTYGGCYIDDVLIELLPKCQRPTDFKLVSLGDTYAKFAFSHVGADKYEVKYGLAGFDVDKTGSILSITDTMFTISGLSPNTEYDFYVRAYCSATENSGWSLCERYTTFEVPISDFPYINKFDSQQENALWKFSCFNSLDETDNRWYINDSLLISSDGGATATYQHKVTKTWAYRTFDFEEGVYTISFDWFAQGSVSDYMRVMLVPALSRFTEGSSEIFNFDGSVVSLSATKQNFPSDWIDLTRNGEVFNLRESWDSYSKAFMITPEMAGFYRLVVFWNNDAVINPNSISAAIDNILVEKSECSYPYKLEIEDINSTYLTLSWTPVGSAPKSYNVVALSVEMDPSLAPESFVVSRTTVATTKATIKNLESNTDYFIYVQSGCDGNGTLSYWSEVYKFTTPCDPKPLGTVFSFETSEGYYLPNYVDGEANSYYRIPDCFVVNHSNAEEIPYIKDNTLVYPHAYRSGIKQMARTGEYAMRFYYNSEEKVGGYATLPLVDGNFEDLQVSFWMRPFAAVKNPQGDNVDQEGLNKIYARKITVGTMTNPNDPLTFTPLRVVAYPYSNEDANLATGQMVMDDVEKTDYWRRYSVVLKEAKGKFIAFKNELYDGCEYNQMYIDDVVVDYISDCSAPTGLIVEDATATTARVNVDITTTNAEYEIQISKIEDFTTIWRTDKVSAFPIELKNLEPGQQYYFRTRQICGVTNYSDWSSIANCITAYSTLYSTDLLHSFETSSYSPRYWQRSCGTNAKDIFSREGSAMTTNSASPLGWRVKDNHLVTYVSPNENKELNPFCWIFSPSIELPKGDVTLSFNLALTDDDGVHKADSTVNNKNDKFYVVISDNNGRSWEEHNKFTWTNDGKGDFDYNSIPFEGKTYSIDLTKYAGRVIRIAFYSECTTPSVSSELHIRSVHVNSVVQRDVKSTICQMEDYQFDKFVKLSTELSVGTNKFLYHKHAERISDNDSIFNLEVAVTPLIITSFDAEICDGDVYSEHRFNNITRAGVYKQKIATTRGGCDSVVVVNLMVNPIQKTILTDTICFGATYLMNGKEYNRSGMYVDTLVSSLTGCDSIVTLLLTVTGADIVNDTIGLCSGQEYQFGSRVITKSGTYTETFKSITGCDSVVSLTVNFADDFRLILNEFICPGETYSGHGFKGVPRGGTYTLPLTSVGGCDSTIILNLMELEDDTIYVTQKINLDNLPYTFVDKVYDETTEVGVYKDEFYVTRDSCSSVVLLTLEVEEKVAVENVLFEGLTLYPNPVSVGESIYIDGEFDVVELVDMQVEIYSMLGQRVCLFEPSAKPILVEGLVERGVYIVRIIANTGMIYQGKLIVR